MEVPPPGKKTTAMKKSKITIGVGTRVAISIDQGLQKAEGIIREVETDDVGTAYRVDIISGDPCDEHRTADGELWVCPFEVKPLPA